jgi:GT2 family glycosyltransferase
MNIIAVIVTYNRLKLLKRAVGAVLDQTRKPDRLIVVDNCSSDGTRLWLAQLASSRGDVTISMLDSNQGGAGGFFNGIKEGYEAGADWIWVMDDDTIPEPDALEMLANCADDLARQKGTEKVGFLASQVLWTDGSAHRMNVPGVNRYWLECHPCCSRHIRIDTATFCSTLIHRHAVKEAGYPVKEFFIWMDDVEYTLRITVGAGFSGYLVRPSRVLHLTKNNIGGDEFAEISKSTVWKHKYGARNRVAVEFRRSRFLGAAYAMLDLVSTCIKMQRNRVPLWIRTSVLAAGLKGFIFNYKKLIVYPQG